MRTFFISWFLFFVVFCSGELPKDNPSEYVLEHCRNFSPYSDPAQLAYLYKDLPESYSELCYLIKQQLIHPFERDKFAGEIPIDRMFEDRDFPSVSEMLKELLERDKNGLYNGRQPRDRLLVACVHHSLLLASILRHRGIPVRIRAGFAKYIGDRRDLCVSHVICEVWDQKRSRWILIDPDREKVNFSRNQFEFAYQTWHQLRKDNLPDRHYISRYKNTYQATAHLLIHDLYYVSGSEEPYWLDPPVVEKLSEGISGLTGQEISVFDSLAIYLGNADKHLKDLQRLKAKYDFLQLTDMEIEE